MINASKLRDTVEFSDPRLSWLEDPVVYRWVERMESVMLESAHQETRAPDFFGQLISRRSKRLRAAMLLLCARFGSEISSDQLVRTAAAIELVHEATLYHDDIVDRSDLRRGNPSAQRAFGRATAAFLGSDLLYASASLCSTLPPELRRAVALTAGSLCRGQTKEIEAVGNDRCEPRSRMRMMAGKTASLFVLAARLGTGLAHVPKDVARRLDRFAARFGLCYQLADDLHDLCGTYETLGRHPGRDLYDGVYTLPVLFAMQSADDGLAPVLRRVRQGQNTQSLSHAVSLIGKFRGLRRSSELLSAWGEKARAEIQPLAAVAVDAYQSLENIVGFVFSWSQIVSAGQDL